MSGSRLRWIAPVLVLALGGWEPLWRLDPDVADGNKAYAEQRYDDAIKAYERAKQAGVDGQALEYDLGTAQVGRADGIKVDADRDAAYEEAMGHLAEAAKSKDPLLKGKAHYNRGNVLMKQKKLDEAIDAYKDALRADANLESARVNLELALRHRERKRQQQQQQQQGQGQGQGQGQPQQGQGQGQGQQQQPQQGQGQGQGDQPQPQQGQGQGDQQQPQQGQGQGDQQQPQQGQGQGDQQQQQQQQQQQGQQGQGQQGQGQQGQGQGQPGTAQQQPRWPHDDTEYDTPDTPRESKLEQLEEMSRQQRRDQVRRKSGGDYRWQQEKDW